MNDQPLPASDPVWSGPDSIPVAAITSKMFTRPDDIVIIGGSIAEGMGRFLSDIDVCVLTRRQPTLGDVRHRGHFLVTLKGNAANWVEKLQFGQEMQNADLPDDLAVTNAYDFVDEFGTRCDIEYILIDELEGEIAKLHAGYERAGQRYGWMAEPVGFASLRCFHRLVSGMRVANGAALDEVLRSHFAEKLAYLLFRGSCYQFTDFQDILGSTLSGDWSQAVYHTRNYLLLHLKALTHLFGNTNPNIKWAPAYANRLLPDTQIPARFTALFQGTAVDDGNGRSYIEACLDLGDAMSDLCVDRMNALSMAYPSAAMIGLMRQRMASAGMRDPHLLLSLEFHAKPFFRGTLPARNFLDRKTGLQRCSFA